MACILCALLIVAALAAALKIYIKLNTKWNGSYKCLIGKTAIVTGANSGIGYVTALDFAKRGARVILACRNKERAEEATRKIIAESGNENVVYKLVDMISLRSVRDFAGDVNRNEERLDILVNNAGIGSMNKEFSDDGIQMILHVNHVSGFLLTHLLLDKLKKSAPSRIVNVSSVLASDSYLTVRNFDTLNTNTPPRFFSDNMYRNSKLCNILFSNELAKRLDGTGVTTNALHPGAVYTAIFRGTKGWFKWFVNTIGRVYFWTPEEGAQTQIYVSVSDEVDKINGGFFSNCKEIEIYENAKDADLARMVWLKSEEWAKLGENEKIPN